MQKAGEVLRAASLTGSQHGKQDEVGIFLWQPVVLRIKVQHVNCALLKATDPSRTTSEGPPANRSFALFESCSLSCAAVTAVRVHCTAAAA
jgi:hypothetical protein